MLPRTTSETRGGLRPCLFRLPDFTVPTAEHSCAVQTPSFAPNISIALSVKLSNKTAAKALNAAYRRGIYHADWNRVWLVN